MHWSVGSCVVTHVPDEIYMCPMCRTVIQPNSKWTLFNNCGKCGWARLMLSPKTKRKLGLSISLWIGSWQCSLNWQEKYYYAECMNFLWAKFMYHDHHYIVLGTASRDHYIWNNQIFRFSGCKVDHLQSKIIQFKLEVDACPYCQYLEQQHAWNPLFNYTTSTPTWPDGEDRVMLVAVWQADPHPYQQRNVLCQTSPLNSNNQLYKTRTWLDCCNNETSLV